MTHSSVQAWRRSRTWVAVAAVGLLAACSGQDPAQLIKAGRAHLDKKEYRAASIEFKNALQKDGNLNEARLLLGRTLLESGDSAVKRHQRQNVLVVAIARALAAGCLKESSGGLVENGKKTVDEHRGLDSQRG